MLYLYGLYSREGGHTAPSNQRFDQYLPAQNPAWGGRDIAIIETAGREPAWLNIRWQSCIP
ncbi:DUF938 domain-containing protein [Ectothiorhodospira shaposhnikovii]|uniref:DUF938 domain-containing protein n=1 Tax=Ectothiorhodospira shaposhnikovii TaxID=1054 RepID=UPI001903D31D|nr:DUF938 domain-containing protein [Ectothiorhodospira shaposhnikovii]